MPRPNQPAKNADASGKSKCSNPFRNWLEKRKERIHETKEGASRLITSRNTKNENIIIGKLEAIDFINSALPKSALEAKTKPDQPCGDLEYAAQGIAQMLRKNPQTIKVDIRKFDEKLLTLVLLFKRNVEYGNVRAAYAAKGAIVRAVVDIRNRIPQEQPELTTLFVEANTKYLEQWILLVMLAQVADAMKKNVGEQRARLEADQKRYDESAAALYQRLQADPQLMEAFHSVNRGTDSQNRFEWSDETHEIRQLMVEHRIENTDLEIKKLRVQSLENELIQKEMQVQMLQARVASLPVVSDPALMDRYEESTDEVLGELEVSDAAIEEYLKTMDDLENRIQQIRGELPQIQERSIGLVQQLVNDREEKVKLDQSAKELAAAEDVDPALKASRLKSIDKQREELFENIDKRIYELLENDAEIDATLKFVEAVDNWIQQLDSDSDALRTQEEAAEQGQELIEELAARREAQTEPGEGCDETASPSDVGDGDQRDGETMAPYDLTMELFGEEGMRLLTEMAKKDAAMEETLASIDAIAAQADSLTPPTN